MWYNYKCYHCGITTNVIMLLGDSGTGTLAKKTIHPGYRSIPQKRINYVVRCYGILSADFQGNCDWNSETVLDTFGPGISGRMPEVTSCFSSIGRHHPWSELPPRGNQHHHRVVVIIVVIIIIIIIVIIIIIIIIIIIVIVIIMTFNISHIIYHVSSPKIANHRHKPALHIIASPYRVCYQHHISAMPSSSLSSSSPLSPLLSLSSLSDGSCYCHPYLPRPFLVCQHCMPDC